VLENFASEEECKAMIQRMKELVDDFDPKTIAVFSTKNQVCRYHFVDALCLVERPLNYTSVLL
jgi:hypothetical protein